MTNKLLRDAIADAKAVRETALAHAKAALEEAFTPHITSMLSARLRNEAEEYQDDEDQVDELNDPVSGDGHGSDDGGETDVDSVQSSSHTGDQNVTETVDDKVDHDADALKSSEIAQEPTQVYGTSSPREPASGASAKTSSGDTDNEGLQQPAGTKVSEGIFEDEDELDPELAALGGDEEGEEEEPDLDLEAIIAELEADMVSEMGDDDDHEYDDELPPEDDEPVLEQNDAEVTDGHGPGEGGEKDASVTTDSTFKSTEGEKQTGPISEQEKEKENGEDEEELDLDEILREIETEETQGALQAENTRQASELKEYRDAVKFLRSKLNEVNLLNAKLLYTNRLFKNYSMTGKMKLRVVESFDRATNVREAKLVYTTLAESFRGKPVTRKRRSVTEGLASRAGGSTKPKSDATLPGRQTVLAEGGDLAARFKKLAGITKS